MGIGIGMIIVCILIFPFHQKKLSPGDIESRARGMGMIYADEIKAIGNSEKGGAKE